MQACIDEMTVLATKAQETLAALYKKQSSIDTEINDLYHVIEYVSVSAVEMVKIYNRLKKKLAERRQVKEDISLAMSFAQKLGEVANLANDASKRAENRKQKYKQESNIAYQKIKKELSCKSERSHAKI